MKKNILLFLCFLCSYGLAAEDALSYRLSPSLRETYPHQDLLYFSFLGPFYEFTQNKTTGDLFLSAPRPFFSRCHSDQLKESQGDIIWPIGGWRHREFEKKSYFYPWFLNHTLKDGEVIKKSWGFFPFLCYGIREDKSCYLLLFPLGGSMDNLAGFSHFSCFLWPLWVKTHRGEQISTSYCWPFYSRTTKNGKMIKQRFWPFYGFSTSEKGKKEFILWPFWHRQIGKITPTTPLKQDGYFLFPLYGEKTLTDQHGEEKGLSRSFLWPFFTWEDAIFREKTIRRRTYFWPLYTHITEKDNQDHRLLKERFISFPFYGKTTFSQYKNSTLESTFVLWPFYIRHHADHMQQQYDSKRIALIYHRISTHSNKGQYKAQQIWPLCHWQTDSQNRQYQFSLFSFWPSARQAPPPISRNWAPLWSIYDQYGTQNEFHQRILWGVWERRRTSTFSRYQIWPIFRFDSKVQTPQDKERKKKFSFFFNIFSFSF